ncbi:serine carboxypeptidase-like 50 [Mercurialis annua]|uniref:serine carboxypeptidase-like 50 n=1 Tax=Mercurialis annua TaxID=3986 RepID=UPI00215EA88A|nr:serine carboxypeptidase-like 50 [Mercurialis annua]
MLIIAQKMTQIHFFFFLIFLCFLRQSLSSPSPSPSPLNSTFSFPNEALPTKSGYLPINPKSKSAIFYTFYEAQNTSLPISQTPLIFWLQGGPGCSSMIGNFLELGPFRVVDSLILERNFGSWNRIFGLVFLDNPIGVGFSFAADQAEIPKDQHSVAEHLFGAITEFLNSNTEFKTRPVYITGESYAGKYVPSIGYYILEKNTKLQRSKRVNLKGVAIGNGLTDPVTQVKTHADSAYYSGLINQRQKTELKEAQSKVIEFVKLRNWSEATNARNNVLNLLQNMTGLATLYDYTRKVPYKTSLVTKLLQSVEVKKALGANVSMIFDECSKIVGEKLHEDVMKSVKFKVDFLVMKIKVLLYQGLFDLRDGVVSTEAWVRTMKWGEIKSFLMAEREIWKVNGEVAGYVQKWGNLSNVVVLGTGHLVPTDQGLHSQAMIEDWVLDKGNFAWRKYSESASE